MNFADNSNRAIGESATFIAIEVERGPAAPEGLCIRFKQYGAERNVNAVPYESLEGLQGIWQVRAVDHPQDTLGRAARACMVQDAADGLVWLIAGGRQGLVLRHPSGTVVREPYLVLPYWALA